MSSLPAIRLNEQWQQVDAGFTNGKNYQFQNKDNATVLVYEGISPNDVDATLLTSGVSGYFSYVNTPLHMRAKYGTAVVAVMEV